MGKSIRPNHEAMIPQPTYDLCIIGSGAMGIAMAISLAERGKTVLLLEAGTDEVSENSQDFYQCESKGRPHPGSSDGRFRVYGGSTERWGGQAMRFDEIDFKSWPVTHEEISPYYREAEKLLGITDPPYDALWGEISETAGKLRIPAGSLESALRPFKIHNSVYTKKPRLRENFHSRLQHPAITLMKGAAATALITDGCGSAVGLIVQTEEGKKTVHAGKFVLACGGVENARFLLLQIQAGQAAELTSHQAIGRYFQDHPGAHLAEIYGLGAVLFQNTFRLKDHPDITSKGRISWSEISRARYGHLAVSGTFLMSRAASPCDAEKLRKKRVGNASEWLMMLKALSKGIPYSPLHYTVLAVSAEDANDPESRITLSPSKFDRLGHPRAVVEWKVSPAVPESILQYLTCFEKFILDQNLGHVRRFKIAEDAASLAPALSDNSHHIGTTRMGTGPDDAVVDANLKIFGLRNFYVAGTSTLPTGSHANPTLTALALCFRLVDHLCSENS